MCGGTLLCLTTQIYTILLWTDISPILDELNKTTHPSIASSKEGVETPTVLMRFNLKEEVWNYYNRYGEC